jgi:hypothetical protein
VGAGNPTMYTDSYITHRQSSLRVRYHQFNRFYSKEKEKERTKAAIRGLAVVRLQHGGSSPSWHIMVRTATSPRPCNLRSGPKYIFVRRKCGLALAFLWLLVREFTRFFKSSISPLFASTALFVRKSCTWSKIVELVVAHA